MATRPSEWSLERGADGMPARMFWRGPQHQKVDCRDGVHFNAFIVTAASGISYRRCRECSVVEVVHA